MKKLIVILFLSPLAGFAQCPVYVGASVDDILKLLPVAEQYAQLKMEMVDTTGIEYNEIVFKDQQGFASIRFGLTDDKKVSRIYITGQAERIDKMVNEFFIPKIKDCQTKASPTWIFWSDQKLVYHDYQPRKGVKMKFIEIEKS